MYEACDPVTTSFKFIIYLLKIIVYYPEKKMFQDNRLKYTINQEKENKKLHYKNNL